jgi:hypothetical protein
MVSVQNVPDRVSVISGFRQCSFPIVRSLTICLYRPYGDDEEGEWTSKLRNTLLVSESLGINWDFEIRYNLDLYNDYGSKIRVKDCNVLSYSDRRK